MVVDSREDNMMDDSSNEGMVEDSRRDNMVNDNSKYSMVNESRKDSSKEYMFLFTNPSARAGYDTRSIFKRSLTGLNSEFSFS